MSTCIFTKAQKPPKILKKWKNENKNENWLNWPKKTDKTFWKDSKKTK